MEKEICECKRDYKSPLSGICELCWDEKFPDEKETVEEASERYWVKQPYNEDAFIKGAEWQAEQEQSAFVKKDDVDGEWLSPVATERVWQEEQLVNIFGHYPNASPRWQYMNGLIQNSLQAERMYTEEEAGELVYNIIGEYGKHYGIMIDGAKLNELFEQFKKK